MTKRNTFSREFKIEAVRLLEKGDKNASDLARELGVPRLVRLSSPTGPRTVRMA
jgi:transposase-like protein